MFAHDNVPGGIINHAASSGYFNVVLTNADSFYVGIYCKNIKNVIMSHIHFYNPIDRKKNGNILLWLFKSMNKPLDIKSGYLVARNFTSDDFSEKISFNSFLELIKQNKLYINVHTIQNPNGELAAPLIITKTLY
jgi:hypothetical protein